VDVVHVGDAAVAQVGGGGDMEAGAGDAHRVAAAKEEGVHTAAKDRDEGVVVVVVVVDRTEAGDGAADERRVGLVSSNAEVVAAVGFVLADGQDSYTPSGCQG